MESRTNDIVEERILKAPKGNGYERVNIINAFVLNSSLLPSAVAIILKATKEGKVLYVPAGYLPRIDKAAVTIDAADAGYTEILLHSNPNDFECQDFRNSYTQLRFEFPFIIYTPSPDVATSDAFTLYLQGYAGEDHPGDRVADVLNRRVSCSEMFKFERADDKSDSFIFTENLLGPYAKASTAEVHYGKDGMKDDLKAFTVTAYDYVDERRRLVQENRRRRLAHLNAEHQDRLRLDREYLAKLAIDQ